MGISQPILFCLAGEFPFSTYPSFGASANLSCSWLVSFPFCLFLFREPSHQLTWNLTGPFKSNTVFQDLSGAMFIGGRAQGTWLGSASAPKRAPAAALRPPASPPPPAAAAPGFARTSRASGVKQVAKRSQGVLFGLAPSENPQAKGNPKQFREANGCGSSFFEENLLGWITGNQPQTKQPF